MEYKEGMKHEMAEGEWPFDCPMCQSPPNRPVPYAQSTTAMNEGYAVQVRSYPEVAEVEPLKISGRTR